MKLINKELWDEQINYAYRRIGDLVFLQGSDQIRQQVTRQVDRQVYWAVKWQVYWQVRAQVYLQLQDVLK
jgi:dissimilatory sulfite reductase (desulfoviridin) alpha/beta subunit